MDIFRLNYIKYFVSPYLYATIMFLSLTFLLLTGRIQSIFLTYIYIFMGAGLTFYVIGLLTTRITIDKKRILFKDFAVKKTINIDDIIRIEKNPVIPLVVKDSVKVIDKNGRSMVFSHFVTDHKKILGFIVEYSKNNSNIHIDPRVLDYITE